MTLKDHLCATTCEIGYETEKNKVFSFEGSFGVGCRELYAWQARNTPATTASNTSVFCEVNAYAKACFAETTGHTRFDVLLGPGYVFSGRVSDFKASTGILTSFVIDGNNKMEVRGLLSLMPFDVDKRRVFKTSLEVALVGYF